MKGKIISVEGIVGAGKSTLCESLNNYLTSSNVKCKIFSEYVNEHLLGLYLNDMKKYAFSFQAIMVTVRKNVYREAIDYMKSGGVAIVDRSLFGDFAFASMQKDKNFFTNKEWETYLSIYKETKFPQDSIIFYLDCSPNTAIERIKIRGNVDEIKSYSKKYFEDLRDSYEKTLKMFKDDCGVNIKKMDFNENRAVKKGIFSNDVCRQVLDFF